VERLETVCTGKLVWCWALYAWAVAFLTHYVEAAGYPDAVAWVLGGVLGCLVLLWTREI